MGTPVPKPVPPLAYMPPVPPGDDEGAQSSEIHSVPPRYVYIHIHSPNAQFFNLDVHTKNCKYNKDLTPDLLTDTEVSIG